jgi:putative ABC transport system permease protein
MDLFAIALRNVFRNPRRTILNLIAIGLGVMIILTMKGWIGGLATSAYQTTIDLDTAHAQVLNSGYEAEAQRKPLDLDLKDWKKIQTAVAALPEVAAAGARVDFGAAVTNGETEIPVSVRGVDPDGEAATNSLKTTLVEGRWFSDDAQVIIGSGLARKLNLKPGDQIYLKAADRYNVRNEIIGTVGAVFTSNYGLFDDGVVYTTLTAAQELLSLDAGEATRVVIRFRDPQQIDRGVAAVNAALRTQGLDAGHTVYPWKEFAQGLVGTLESRMRVLTFMMFILIALVTVGILNSMSMAVQERFREIGTLRAIGMNRRQLARLFLLEGFSLGLAGGLAGIIGAGGLAWLGLAYGIVARHFLPRDVPVPLVSVMRPLYSWFDFPLAPVLAALVATLGSILPARRAGNMVIRDVLGSHV